MAKNEDIKMLHCSFCGKAQDQVERMIAGPGVCICNECVELCQTVLDGEAPAHSRRTEPEPTDITILKLNILGLIITDFLTAKYLRQCGLSALASPH